MSASKVCPNCQFANPEDAARCERCDTALAPDKVETIRFVDLPEMSAQQRKPGYHGKTFPGFLAIYVMDETSPILFEDKGTLTLGRSALGEKPPTVNLTRYHAGLLGVSRRHAAIEVTEQGHVITDLNSSNGSWVNQEPLTPGKPQPLRSGDTVRLGHLMLHVYYDEETSNGEPIHEGVITPLTPQPSDLGALTSVTLRLVGRPAATELRPSEVIVRMIYLPAPATPDDITGLPVVPTRFTAYLSPAQWDSVKAGLDEPGSQLIIEGPCTYGKEIQGIVVRAAQVSLQQPTPEAKPLTSAPVNPENEPRRE